jgi:hypothetical protein
MRPAAGEPSSHGGAREELPAEPEVHDDRRGVWAKLLRFLRADPEASGDPDGRWPSTWATFLWDIAPAKAAPDSEGVIGPEWSPPEWVAAIAEDDLAGAVEEERARHRDTRDAVTAVEGKASRLLTPTVTLLTATAALVAFELNGLAGKHSAEQMTLTMVGSITGSVAALLLFAAIIRALDADTRVGTYRPGSTANRAHGPRRVLAEEALGTAVAAWTLRHKLTRLMYARSVLSRAVVLVGIALVCGAVRVITNS